MADTAHIILLVDDDKFLLDMYSLKFSQAGYAVHPCFSVNEALTELRGGLQPDAILFDITMPGDDGFALIQKIKEDKKRNLKEIELAQAIRYADNDPVESWLNKLLCLDSLKDTLTLYEYPHLNECDLYLVNRLLINVTAFSLKTPVAPFESTSICPPKQLYDN